VDIAGDKVLTKRLLDRAGIPVPDGVLALTQDEAVAALGALGAPLVLKPRGGNHGRSVTVCARTPDEVARAYQRAAAHRGSAEVIVERYVPGRDYRVLVVDGAVTAAAELSPPAVTGDGTSSIGELIDELNADPRRGHGHSRALTKVTVDDAVLAHLAANGLDLGSVPGQGARIALRRNGNLSTGGTSTDVTATVHPDVAELCRRAAGVAGLDICGIDLRLADVAAPLLGPDAQQAAVLEVNACPGLRMHLLPAEGEPQPVAEAIIDRLYPPGALARIPVISVTGTNGKTTTVRMIAHMLRQAGIRTGMACTDGVHIGDRCVLRADASGPRSAELVLDDATVEAAVVETARGGILRGGLGYDQADVAVITNISADHLGEDCVDDIAELTEVKALVAEEIRDGGCVVLNADDPVTAALASRRRVASRAPAVRYFSVTPGNPVIDRHKRAGGLCYEVCEGQLTETAAGRQRVIMNVNELPGAFGGLAAHVVANALAATAAARAAGVSAKDVREALRTFTPAESNPGRGNVYAVAAGPQAATAASPVIVDYGHNAAALAATGQFLAKVWGGEPAAAITLPGDRRDDLVTESARAVAAWFGKVCVYEDDDLRGRQTGEMRALITAALSAARPGICLAHADGPADALRQAIALAAGSPVLFVYEKLDAARAALDDAGATPWPEEDLMGGLNPGPLSDIPGGSPARGLTLTPSGGMTQAGERRPERLAVAASDGAAPPGDGPAGDGRAGDGPAGDGPAGDGRAEELTVAASDGATLAGPADDAQTSPGLAGGAPAE